MGFVNDNGDTFICHYQLLKTKWPIYVIFKFVVAKKINPMTIFGRTLMCLVALNIGTLCRFIYIQFYSFDLRNRFDCDVMFLSDIFRSLKH